MGDGTRVCGKCQIAKPTEAFYPDPLIKKGRRKYCAECMEKVSNLKISQHRVPGICTQCDLPHDGPGVCCSKCLETRRQVYANRDKNCCQSCHKPELITTLYCETCWLKDTARRLLGDRSFWADLKELFVKQNGLCALSGVPLRLGQNASLDHIIPSSKNGVDDISNYRWAHTKVNQLRGNLTDEEFYDLCVRVVATLGSENISCERSLTWLEPYKNGIF